MGNDLQRPPPVAPTKQTRKDFHQKIYKNPPETVVALGEAADRKSRALWHRVFVLGILAGVFIGIGGAASVTLAGGLYTGNTTLVGHDLPILPKALAGAAFPIGLILVVLLGAELFTGNTLVMSLGLLGGKVTVPQLLASWGLSYLGNYIGSVIFALIMWGCGTWLGQPYLGYLSRIGHAKTNDNWGVNFLKGIPCNVLVCAAISMATAAEDVMGKFIAVYTAVFTFILCGFEHSIANMFFVTSAALYDSTIDYPKFLWNSLLPVTLGNIVGAFIFLSLPYWYIYYLVSAPTNIVPSERIKRREPPGGDRTPLVEHVTVPMTPSPDTTAVKARKPADDTKKAADGAGEAKKAGGGGGAKKVEQKQEDSSSSSSE